jgi:predicted transcriptional regulator
MTSEEKERGSKTIERERERYLFEQKKKRKVATSMGGAMGKVVGNLKKATESHREEEREKWVIV